MTTVQMIPPGDGSRNMIAVSGRTYSALPQMSATVQSFDVPALTANGWQVVPPTPLSGGPGESWASRLRRLALAAKNNNPIDNDKLNGSVAWTPSMTATAAIVPGVVYKLSENTANSAHFTVLTLPSTVSGQNIIFSVYVQAVERSAVQLNIFNGTTTIRVDFNISTQASNNVNGATTFSITPAGAGWYLCTLATVMAATAQPTVSMSLENPYLTTSYTGTAGSGILFSGASYQIGGNPATLCLPFPSETNSTVAINAAARPLTIATYANLGTIVSNGGNVYVCTVGGTASASGGPIGFGPTITDGTITWAYLGPQTAPVVSALYTTHNAVFSQNFPINTSLDFKDGGRWFRLTGGVPYSNSGFGQDFLAIGATVVSGGNLDGATKGGNYNAITFIFEGSILEAHLYTGNPAPISIIVDGQYLDSTIAVAPGTVESFFTIDFTGVNNQIGVANGTGRQIHEITIEFPALPFLGINTLTSAAISYPEVIDNFSVGLIGDSQVPGSNQILSQNAYGIQLRKLLGLPDMMLNGIGATGFVAPGTNYPYIGHAVSDMQLLNAFRPLGLILIRLRKTITPILLPQ
jgi:hypothetical protein